MFKSKAQKEAEHRLKVEQEMERIRQRKEAAQRQKEAAIAWVNASPDNRNLILTGIAGLFTGGLAGAIVSPIAFHQYSKRINNSAMKWLAWAGTGLIAAPILIGAQAAMFGGGTEPQSITAKNKVTQVEETKTVAAAPETTLSPSAEATPAPVSTPKPLTPEEKFAQTLTSAYSHHFGRVNSVTSAPDSHRTSAGLISSASTGQLGVDQIACEITFAPNDNMIALWLN